MNGYPTKRMWRWKQTEQNQYFKVMKKSNGQPFFNHR